MFKLPGGNFVSAYDYRDGLGDRDKRPPRLQPMLVGASHPRATQTRSDLRCAPGARLGRFVDRHTTGVSITSWN